MKIQQVPSRKSLGSKLLSVAVVISVILSIYALYRVLTLRPGESFTLPPGVTVQKEPLRIDRVTIDGDGNLIATYTDGSSRVVGPVRGRDGATPVIGDSLIATAVAVYCSDGRCDGRNPTVQQVANALQEYCANDNCRGPVGPTGETPVITDAMLGNAVTAYCSSERCRGPIGPVGPIGPTGNTGPAGRTATFSCVLRTRNNLTVKSWEWKYEDQENTAYQLVFEYTNWQTQPPPESCIDLRA